METDLAYLSVMTLVSIPHVEIGKYFVTVEGFILKPQLLIVGKIKLFSIITSCIYKIFVEQYFLCTFQLVLIILKMDFIFVLIKRIVKI